MKRLIAALLCAGLLNGCSFLGLSVYRQPERVPSAQVGALHFPDSFETGVHLEGASAAALEVAMRDFFPPGAEAHGHDDNEAMAKCLAQRGTYDISVLRAEERVFVRFTPFVSRCGLDEVILDGGAVYAIDGAGRILDVR